MKNSFKRVLAVALSAAMVLTAAPLASINANAATKVKLSATKGTIKVGKTKKVTIKGLKKSNIKSVKFTYSNTKKRVTVKRSGLTIKITGKKKGTVTVTATIKLKKAVNKKKTYKLKYKATVKKATATKVATTKIELPAEVTVEAGKTATVTATRTPSNANDDITWTSKDETIATVANGVVTGVKEGETEISAVAGTATPAVAKVIVKAPTASADVKITGAKVTAADTIEVTFADTMDKDKLAISLALGTVDIAKTVTWNDLATVATLKTTANLAKGTYTITASYAETDAKDSKTVEVEAEKATEIKILNTTALTGKATLGAVAGAKPAPGPNDVDGALAYAYYDVLDQYGNSMRSSVSIEWSASCEKQIDKATGKITLWKGDNKAFTYGEKVYVTGVDTKTGLVVNQELSIGQAQALDSIKMVGFIKKGTTTILQTVPKNFKAGEYQLVFSILDQNGNEMDASDIASLKDEVTFTTDDVLVVSKVEVSAVAAETHVTLGGVVYGIASLEPGINVSKGGAVKITAIANKTGKQTPLEINVEVEALLTNFTIGSPMGIIADGESVQLSFEATDADGKAITSFKTIAQNKTFNTLSFSVSGNGTLSLSEQDDGTAQLWYTDGAALWTDSTSTDGIDRTVSLTSIVVGGNTSSEILQISDKAYPASVLSTSLNEVYVEGSQVDINALAGGTTAATTRTFEFVDQYGRSMKSKVSGDNGFFSAQNGTGMGGTEFSGYTFGLRATYLGNGGFTTALRGAAVATKAEYVQYNGVAVAAPFVAGGTIRVFTSTKIDGGTMTSEDWKFDIVKSKTPATAGTWQSVSKAYNHSATIVDIANVSDFAIGDLDKFYLGASGNTAPDGFMATTVDNIDAVVASAPGVPGYAGGLNATAANHAIYVTGKYNGKTVAIPANYLQLTANKLTSNNTYNTVGAYADGAQADGYGLKFANTMATLVYSDLYDKGKTNYPAKDGGDTMTINIASKYGNTENLHQGSGAAADGARPVTGVVALGDAIASVDQVGAKITSVSKKFTFSDQAKHAASFYGINDEFVVNPITTVVANASMVTPANWLVGWGVLDQYGTAYTGTAVSYKVSAVKEASGYVDNNLKAVNNDSTTASIEGAELGDTYTLTLTCEDLTKDFKVTVGGDVQARIRNSNNDYLNVLVGTGAAVLPVGSLEYQRQQIMK